MCVSLPSFLMDVQRGERQSIIYAVFIWSFMLEFKTDEELKRWPDFCRCSFSKEKEEKEPLVELLRASTPTSPMMLLLMLGDKEKLLGTRPSEFGAKEPYSRRGTWSRSAGGLWLAKRS